MTVAAVDRRPDLAPAFKDAESWWVVLVVDPIVVRLLPSLLRRPRVTPNLVTAAAFVDGLLAITAFALGQWLVGALLYELRFVLDCIDGKIARCRGLSSARGAAFDRVADFLTIPGAYAAIGLRLAADSALPPTLALLPALVCALVFVVELALEAVRRGHRPTATFRAAVEQGAGVVGWMRRHRLTLRPWTVEAEAIGLFLAPLLLRHQVLAAVELALVAVYGAFIAVDIALVARAAVDADRAGSDLAP